MSITINGSGTITGMSAGGLPDASVVAADLASSLDLTGKTVTLPTGTGGKVVNTAQVTIDSTATFNSQNAFARFAAMDAAYTTTVAGKLIVTFSWMITNSASSSDLIWQIKRKIGSGAATEILVNANPVNLTSTAMISNFRENTGAQGIRVCYTFIDTPGHTAGDVITYEHHVRCEGSNTLNLNHGAQTQARHGTSVSTVVFMEVTS